MFWTCSQSRSSPPKPGFGQVLVTNFRCSTVFIAPDLKCYICHLAHSSAKKKSVTGSRLSFFYIKWSFLTLRSSNKVQQNDQTQISEVFIFTAFDRHKSVKLYFIISNTDEELKHQRYTVIETESDLNISVLMTQKPHWVWILNRRWLGIAVGVKKKKRIFQNWPWESTPSCKKNWNQSWKSVLWVWTSITEVTESEQKQEQWLHCENWFRWTRLREFRRIRIGVKCVDWAVSLFEPTLLSKKESGSESKHQNVGSPLVFQEEMSSEEKICLKESTLQYDSVDPE